jgi:hypothetical protein
MPSLAAPASGAARALAERAGLVDQIDWAAADEVVRAREGVARPVGRRNMPHDASTVSR